MDRKFVGDRLKIARKYRNFTLKELSEKVVSTLQLISFLEKGQRNPKPDLVEAFGQTLGFKTEFFYEPLKHKIKEHECNFRHLSSTPEKLKKRVLAYCTLFSIIIDFIKTKLEFPEYNIPKIDVRNKEDIRKAAIDCRKLWELRNNAPISNMVRVLENAGVITHIYHMHEEGDKIDAFSRFGEITFVMLNDKKDSSSRSVWNAAHELGHLVMHIDSDKNLKQREEEANGFAAEFLLPKDGFIREFGLKRKIEWSHIFNMKQKWRTSASSIVRRAYELGVIDAIQYRRAYKFISAQGWRRGNEPYEFEHEKPELLNNSLDMLEVEFNITKNNLVNSLHFSPTTFEELTGVGVNNDHEKLDVTNLNEFAKNKEKP